jgi:pimeloyl-ACP methyl ester carboxylesterase
VVGGVTLVVRTWRATEELHPPVVLLPATGETAEDWDVVASTLVASRTVHAVNLRGHGPSDWPGSYSIQLLADDVTGLLAQLGDQPIDLVGHSLGGLVACLVASSHPELIRRLVLEDVGLLRPRPAALPAKPPGVLPFDWRMVEQVRPEIDDPDPQWAQVAATIVAPALVIAGGPSSPVPHEQLADLVGTLPAGQLVTIDAGHLVHATEPDEFVHAVRGFLDRCHQPGGLASQA